MGGKKGSGKQSIALLFWLSTDSGDYLERLLVASKLRPADWCRWIEPIELLAIHILNASDSMARSIYTNQQAFAHDQKPIKIIPTICLLPEQQCNMLCLPDPFFPTHTQKKKKRRSKPKPGESYLIKRSRIEHQPHTRWHPRMLCLISPARPLNAGLQGERSIQSSVKVSNMVARSWLLNAAIAFAASALTASKSATSGYNTHDRYIAMQLTYLEVPPY